MDQFCIHCGSPLSPDSAFCTSCGIKVQGKEQVEVPNQSLHAVMQQADPWESDKKKDEQNHPGPIRFIAESFHQAIASLTSYFKNPKKLIPILILAAVWLILSILPALGFNPLPVRLLSFATFAQGGMYGGFWGAVGGVLGKAIFAYFFSVLLIPLVTGKVSTKGFFSGMKRYFAGFYIHTLSVLAPLLAGIGLSLIIFNFLSGNASLVNSMPGIVGMILAIRAFIRQRGFIWGFILSIFSRISKGKIPPGPILNRFVAGYAAGSLSGVALSVIRIPYLPYLLGLILILAAIIVSIVVKTRKEAISA